MTPALAFSFALSCLRSYVLLRCNCLQAYLATKNTVTFVQGIFYGVVYDTSQYSINLEKKQLVFSVILYVIAIICLFMFNYFNRTEKSFLDESKEVNNEFTESSKMKVEEGDVEFDQI